MVQVAITGVNGFIGSHLAEELKRAEHAVVGLCRQGADQGNLIGVDIELRYTDLGDTDGLAQAFAGCDLVFHVAGLTKPRRPQDLIRVNAHGAANVIEAACAAGVKRLVLVSSLAAAGPATPKAPRQEAQPATPVSRYGHSKRSGELEVWPRAGDISLAIVRPPIVYGPRDGDMLENIRVANRGLVLKPGAGPDRYFSLIHVADLVRLLRLVGQHPDAVPAGEDPQRPSGRGIFHVDDGNPVTWTELSRLSAEILGRSYRVVTVPFALQRVLAHGSFWLGRIRGRAPIFNPDKVREASQVGWVTTAARAREILDFRPEVDLKSGMRATIRWYQEHGLL